MEKSNEIITAPEKVRCPACAAAVYLYDPSRSVFAGCAQCGNFLDLSDRENPMILRKFQSNYWTLPLIPMGSVGSIDGRDGYTLTGFLLKHDPEEDIFWREYLLSHPEQENYRVLAETDGHWTMVWRQALADDFYFAKWNNTVAAYQNGPTYEHYTGYTFELCWAVGEFDWNVLLEDRNMRVDEYYLAPNLLVREQMNGKEEWYRGKYLPSGIVATAFKIDPKLLPRQKDASVLRGKYQDDTDARSSSLSRFTLLMVVLMGLAIGCLYLFKAPRTVLDSSYTLVADSNAWNYYQPLVTPSFEIRQDGAVDIKFHSDVSNQWLELSVTLVNDKTGDAFEATKSIEYYFGNDGGESWTEGDVDERVIFSAVPSGKYHLNVLPYAEFRDRRALRIAVEEASMLSSNIWLMALVILFWPGILWLIQLNKNS